MTTTINTLKSDRDMMHRNFERTRANIERRAVTRMEVELRKPHDTALYAGAALGLVVAVGSLIASLVMVSL